MSAVTDGTDSPRTAVVCDDDPVVRRIVTAVLQRRGFGRIEQTPFASEAVERPRPSSRMSSCST